MLFEFHIFLTFVGLIFTPQKYWHSKKIVFTINYFLKIRSKKLAILNFSTKLKPNLLFVIFNFEKKTILYYMCNSSVYKLYKKITKTY